MKTAIPLKAFTLFYYAYMLDPKFREIHKRENMCAALFVYFVQWWGGGQTIRFMKSQIIDCCSQSLQLHNACVGGTNKSEKEINGKRTKSKQWIDFGIEWDLLSELSTHKEKSSGCQFPIADERDNADGDSDQSWKIRRWYRLEVKIALIWNNITFKKELTVPCKELHNLLWVISTERVFCPEIITITVPSGSVIAPRWHCRLLNCHGAPCFGRAHTWTDCPQDWLAVYLLHLFDIFTT